MQPRHQDEPTDQGEGDASGHHSDAPEGVDDPLLSFVHLDAFEVLLEQRPISLDELRDPGSDGNPADGGRGPLATWVGEDRADGRLRRVVRWRFVDTGEELEREQRQRGVGDTTPGKPQPFRDARRVIPSLEGVEDGTHKAPDRVGAETDRRPRERTLLEAAARLQDVGYLINYDQHHKHSYHLILNSRLEGFQPQELELIANVARYHRGADPKRHAQRERAHGRVEHAANDVAGPLEQLQP